MATKAAGQPSKPTAVAPKAALPKPGASASAPAAASKMHKRSRSGCFTCRLRRKKCDEGKPHCKACKHLGVMCEYKRPLWWSNNEQRKQHKENIKNIIKRTKLSEKNAKNADSTGADSPPGLTHSLPTSATYSDNAGRARGNSEESDCSFDFNAAPAMPHGAYDMYNLQVYTPGFDPTHPLPPYAGYPNAPYEVDIHTERQMYVDDVPTRKDSSHLTYSTFQLPPHGSLAPLPEGDWSAENIYDTPGDMFSEEKDAPDFGFFDFQHAPLPSSSGQATVSVDEADRPLLEHFIENVLPLIFPILEVYQPGTARSEVVLPALETNRCYLHCCLSIAAIHLKSSLAADDPAHDQLDSAIVSHRYSTIVELCEALNRDTDHAQILEATLGMIFFQCTVGRPDDALPDIPWHQHFQAATSLVRKLDLPGLVEHPPSPTTQPPFNMTLAAWIDVLGATMQGSAPQFANSYRELHLAGRNLGLLELMGCEDRTMFLISEIACLDALKLTGSLDHTSLCSHIALLGQEMDNAEVPPAELESAVSAGAVRPRHLARNMTALFLKAARIWLVSLVPGAARHDPALLALQQQFADLLGFVPTGPGGYDRSIVWPLLMAGVQSTPDGPFRAALAERVATMGPAAADTGAFGRVRRVLAEVWAAPEDASWRHIMQTQGWDFLLL